MEGRNTKLPGDRTDRFTYRVSIQTEKRVNTPGDVNAIGVSSALSLNVFEDMRVSG